MDKTYEVGFIGMAGIICSACLVGLTGDGQDCQGKDLVL